MSRRKINVEMLKAVEEQILTSPERFDMTVWGKKSRKCGTTACIGGWATVMGNDASLKPCDIRDIYYYESDIFEYGKSYVCDFWNKPKPKPKPKHKGPHEVLGLTAAQGERLFMLGSWPKQFQNAWNATKDPKVKAEVAVARIEFFIQTNGSDRKRKASKKAQDKQAVEQFLEQLNVTVKENTDAAV